MQVVIGLIIGLILSGVCVWLIMRSQIQALESQKQACDEKANLYSSQRETLSKKNEELESRLAEKEHEIFSIMQKSSNADARIEQISDLQERLSAEADKNHRLQSENNSQREAITRLTAETENKEQYAEQKIEQISDLQGDLRTKTEENERLRSENTSQKEIITRLTTELENRKQKIDELKDNLQQAIEEKNRYQEENEQASQRVAEANAQKEQLSELRNKLESKERNNQELHTERNNLREELSSLKTKLEKEQESAREKLELLENAQQKLSHTFKILSTEALQNNNQQFLEAAKQTFENIQQTSQHQLEIKQQAIDNLVSPIGKSLDEFNKQIREVENVRQQDKGRIEEQLQSIAAAHSLLQAETANLTKALRQPIVRGRWGEIQLKRVVEISGMQEYCDFTVQETVKTENGLLRPDLIVTLPSQKKVIIDSKAPLQAYLDALEAQEEPKQIENLKNHAKHIRTHINQLSSKNYWEQVKPTPEFVIMFLPGEVFFSAALQQEPSLIEFGIEKNIILATPTTLITLLKTIEYGWRQEKIAENANAIGELGKELNDRFIKFAEHLISVRRKLDDTVKEYNKAIGSYESRLLSTAKKFNEIGGYSNNKLESIEPVVRQVRLLRQEVNGNS
ncbi:DNA recombination protein RmuC [Myxosarcina sp. GI1]|uniref:DNA recombination protein RmuC n=1 Tax=Myxosarcina sp. GI1 TaxID=1541065 RepID=UPI0006917AA6|nr:DNA recombination protein RmuC [Myxosarcina sp. GI1]